MNLQFGHFWTPDVIKQKTIPFPTSSFDFWANSIVGFLIGKPTKKLCARDRCGAERSSGAISVSDCCDGGF